MGANLILYILYIHEPCIICKTEQKPAKEVKETANYTCIMNIYLRRRDSINQDSVWLLEDLIQYSRTPVSLPSRIHLNQQESHTLH